MERWKEYLIGGILCLCISVPMSIIDLKISAATLVAFTLFAYGAYKAFKREE